VTEKLALEHPVTLADGSVIRALMVRVPTPEEAFDLRVAMYARCCDVDPAIIGELDATDFDRLAELISSKL
jgi:hypothetical protein